MTDRLDPVPNSSVPIDVECRLEQRDGLIAEAPTGLGLLSPDLRFVCANPMLARINGLPPEHHISRAIREIRPDLADTLEPVLRRVLDTGVPARIMLANAEVGNSSDRPMAWPVQFSLLRSSNGAVLGITVVAHPEAREEEPQSTISLDGGRTDSVPCRFAYLETLAHDLKNQLTPILSASQMLRRYGSTKPDVVDWAGVTIEHQVRKMAGAVSDLLELSRIALGTLELARTRFDLQAVLARVAEVARDSAATAKRTLVVDFPNDALWVLADADRIEKAACDLVLAAVSLAPEGTSTQLRAALELEEVVIRVHAPDLILAPALLEGLFDPFRARDSQIRGTPGSLRVGLALARALVTLHGGTLCADGLTGNHGTEFVLSLPAMSKTACEPG